MDWRLFIALRYFKVRRKEKFVSIISLISILGVAVGVAALIVVLAVMSGFDNELKSRLIGTNAHIYIERDGGIAYPDLNITQVLNESNEVLSYTPFMSGQVILSSKDVFAGSLVTGIDEDTEKTVIDIKKYIIKGDRSPLEEDGLLIGGELARELGLEIGDRVSLVCALSKQPIDFKVTSIFRTGLYTFDAQNIFISLKAAQGLFRINDKVGGVAVKISDERQANILKKSIISRLGYPYFVKSWMDLNANLFSALKLEKLTMFVILTLIVIVACFNIASTLIVKVVEKTKDIGILKSIGATNRDIRYIFRIEGFFIGAVGTFVGVAMGLSISWLQYNYKLIKLPADIYYIDALPIYISLSDSVVIAASALTLSLLATLYPAGKASKLQIVDALRYE